MVQKTFFPGGGTLEETIASLESLARDLRHIQAGIGPADDDLRHAPRLDCWQIGPKQVPALYGMVSDHPKLGPGVRSICTSPVFAISSSGIWARTHSRYYVLGRGIEQTNLVQN